MTESDVLAKREETISSVAEAVVAKLEEWAPFVDVVPEVVVARRGRYYTRQILRSIVREEVRKVLPCPSTT